MAKNKTSFEYLTRFNLVISDLYFIIVSYYRVETLDVSPFLFYSQAVRVRLEPRLLIMLYVRRRRIWTGTHIHINYQTLGGLYYDWKAFLLARETAAALDEERDRNMQAIKASDALGIKENRKVKKYTLKKKENHWYTERSEIQNSKGEKP